MSMRQKEFETLNKIADDYDVSDFDRRMRHFMMRTLRPHLRPGKALEMGCFQGEFTSLLAGEYPDLTVVDAAESFIEITRRRVGARVKFVLSLFETFQSNQLFDAIFLLHVLEHVEDAVALLAKAKSLLTPTGRVFVIVPNGGAASRQIAVKMGVLPSSGALSEADQKHGHRRVYFMDTLQRDARQAGLRVIESGGIFFKPLANYQFDRLIGGDVISDAYMEGCYDLGKDLPLLSASLFLVCEKG